jgi:hypothetical protein
MWCGKVMDKCLARVSVIDRNYWSGVLSLFVAMENYLSGGEFISRGWKLLVGGEFISRGMEITCRGRVY